MKKVLHIIANPRGEDISSSKLVSKEFIKQLKLSNCEIEELDLYKENIEHLSLESLNSENTKMLDMSNKFASFDYYVITAPMWNLSMPSILKSYLDHVLLAGVCFKYNKYGVPVGLLKNKKAIFILSRGGIYSFWPLSRWAYDKNYLRSIFKMIGIKDIHFIEIEGIDKTPNKKDVIINKAINKAKKLASKI